jgi:sulfide dehydrogenase cytochrome subunit
MKNKPLQFAVVFGLALAANAASADIEAKVRSCNGCHGENGVSEWDDMPTIAGIDAFSHSEAFYAYLDGGRPCATVEFRTGPLAGEEGDMCTVAETLSEDDITEIAEHYAALPFVPAKQDFDAALAEAGKAIHEDSCDRCHTEGGSNPEDEAGILAGRWMGYMRRTFDEYAAEERWQPDKMKEVMDPLSEGDVEALIHYYASQQ